ncbi:MULTISPECIES: hypothetical protein [unclassified Pedobacter]|uniref:hypothetical protein n=1 Tax=unclassified Pedobacter TaxID=2628915 RepID=UPI001E5A42BF|nr:MULTISPECIES: hypothetical protein [unclassified Pedobacter]
MEKLLLAIDYFRLKERALLQRHHIDYTMAEHLKDLKEDKSTGFVEHIERYKNEIKAAETEFEELVQSLQPLYTPLYEHLNSRGASKSSPCVIGTTSISLEMYIDEQKNIHYNKI